MSTSSLKRNRKPRPPKLLSTPSSSNLSYYKSDTSIDSDIENDKSPPRKFSKREHQSCSTQHDPITSFSPIQNSLPATQEEVNQLASQDISFDRLPDSQGLNWSQSLSEIEDSQISSPFLFDTIEINENKEFEKAESVISDFTDDEIQKVRPHSIDQVQSIDDIEDDDGADSIISDFSIDDPIAPLPPPPPTSIEQKPAVPVPVEFYIPISKIPKPTLPRFRQLQSSESKFVQLKRNGLADTALQTILTEKRVFDRWDNEINGYMSKYGSMVKVCQKQSACPLFRMTDTWIEGGLVFSWCVPLNQDDIVILDTSQQNTQTDSTNDLASQSTIWSFATPQYTLPEYEPNQDDQRTLFAFSFAYMRTVSNTLINRFIDEEKVVGIWPEWTEHNVSLADYGSVQIKLVTKFKADSIY